MCTLSKRGLIIFLQSYICMCEGENRRGAPVQGGAAGRGGGAARAARNGLQVRPRARRRARAGRAVQGRVQQGHLHPVARARPGADPTSRVPGFSVFWICRRTRGSTCLCRIALHKRTHAHARSTCLCRNNALHKLTSHVRSVCGYDSVFNNEATCDVDKLHDMGPTRLTCQR